MAEVVRNTEDQFSRLATHMGVKQIQIFSGLSTRFDKNCHIQMKLGQRHDLAESKLNLGQAMGNLQMTSALHAKF